MGDENQTQNLATEGHFDEKSEKRKDVRSSNIIACKAIADCVRTSLGMILIFFFLLLLFLLLFFFSILFLAEWVG